MFKAMTAAASIAALTLITAPTLAQDGVAIRVSESQEYGRYIVDADGRALYLFTADTQGQGDEKAKVSCEGQCLDRWPPLYTSAKPQAGDMVEASLLATIEHDGKSMVTYNGWPLYYFAKDQEAGQTRGQDIHSFGGEWYLVSPAGRKVEEK